MPPRNMILQQYVQSPTPILSPQTPQSTPQKLKKMLIYYISLFVHVTIIQFNPICVR